MTTTATILRMAAFITAAALPAACAQPSQNVSQMHNMDIGQSGQPGMQMPGMDMQTMMKHCADMKSMGQGQMSPDMQKMMAQCDGMDRGMGTSQPVPDTHSR